jgi:hypothetical protein
VLGQLLNRTAAVHCHLPVVPTSKVTVFGQTTKFFSLNYAREKTFFINTFYMKKFGYMIEKHYL